MRQPTMLFLLILAASQGISCEPVPTEITIDLYAQGAGFEGIFTIDGDDDFTTFSSAETTTDLFVFEQDVEIEDSIVIDVVPASSEDAGADSDETSMTALTCRIWSSDDEVIFEQTYEIASTNMKSFIYSIE